MAKFQLGRVSAKPKCSWVDSWWSLGWFGTSHPKSDVAWFVKEGYQASRSFYPTTLPAVQARSFRKWVENRGCSRCWVWDRDPKTVQTAAESYCFWWFLCVIFGLILVIYEMDEEYWKDFIDGCMLIDPSDGIPIFDTRPWLLRLNALTVLWPHPYDTWHTNLSYFSVRYLRNSITKVIDGVLSLQCVIDDSWRFWDPCRTKAPCLALHDCFVGRLI